MNRKWSVLLKRRRDLALQCLFLFLVGAGLILTGLASAEDSNLLLNGSFEETDADGHPLGWTEDAYYTEAGYTVFSITEEAVHGGSRAAGIRNIGENDARYAQKVEVEPESLYRFSGYILAKNLEKGRGANLSIEGLYAFSESLYDTEGEWNYIEWYGETGENQTSVTLFARVGGYSGESIGQAWFDDLRLEKVHEVPGDEVAVRWYQQEHAVSYYDEDQDNGGGSSTSPTWPRLILIAGGYSLAAALLIQWMRRRKAGEGTRFKTWVFLAWLAGSMVLRIILSYFVTGYAVDVNCFLSWGQTMAEVGPLSFYPATSFCDYPPAYTYILGLNALICRWIPNISEGMTRVVFRMVPNLCDLAVCLVLDTFLQKQRPEADERMRRIGLLLLAWHPVIILNSACWSQMDSSLALLLTLVAIWAVEDRWDRAFPCFMLAVLVKPQALMLGFLGLLAAVMKWKQNPASRKKMVIGLWWSLCVAAVIIVPFSLRQDPLWIISQYAETLASYPYATVNTANYYYLFGGNWDGIGNGAAAAAGCLLAICAAGYGVYIWQRSRERWTSRWIEVAGCAIAAATFIGFAIAGVSWGTLGTGAMVFAFLIVLGQYARRGEISFLPYMGGTLFLMLYVFGVKMHERYIFPAFFLFALAMGLQKDRRIFLLMLGITVTTFLNEGIVLDNSIRLGSALGHLNADTEGLANGVALINCVLGIYSVWLGAETAMGRGEKEPRRLLQEILPADNRLHWTKKDTALLAGIAAVYSVVCFTTLGSAKAPQTAWTSTEYTESAILDLGEEVDGFTMLYFARVSRYDFSVATSRDGKNWEDETWAQMDQGQCWKWKYVTESAAGADGTRTFGNSRHWFSGRYVRITAHQINLALCETIFRRENGEQIPIKDGWRIDGDPTSPLYSDITKLYDEQDSFEGMPIWFRTAESGSGNEDDPAVAQPGWWNSTYFDEIYHARTAWEFLTGGAPYETSHPPLGKVIMAMGVAIFGMTPFGWRFTGAVAGIAMLAGIYLTAKQMTKSTVCGAAACGLLAMDCMHLTQTQIATIDSYPTLFIMFAFFFMLRYLQSDWRTEKQSRVLGDLCCSGLNMGLAIASKWTGVYAGVGLAVLFFWHGTRILAEKRKREKRGKTYHPAWSLFLRICLWCVLFFVIIPAGIYLASYIPYFAYRKIASFGEYFEAVVNSQISMLSYHSTPGLGMDHPFYSPWYEWPVMATPMFYATKQYVFQNGYSYSIFCFGNPVVWFGGIGTTVACVWIWARGRREQQRITHPASLDTGTVFLLIGLAAQYLPWMMVPRGTYIYHYFGSVPFLILGECICMDQIIRRWPKAGKAVMYTILGMALAGFILFFPYASGVYAPTGWLDLGQRFLSIWY